MSLSRAFTTRRFRSNHHDSVDDGNVPHRSNSSKRPVLRHKISAPVQLVHTTNMLSYNAPDLPRSHRSNSGATKSSDDESDIMSATAESTPPTSPDVPSRQRSSSPEPNHLTMYFKNPARTLVATETPPPAIPKRSPSHTKKNSFDAIARSRSVSRTSRDSDGSISNKTSPTFSRSPSLSTRASSASQVSALQPQSQKQAAQVPDSLPATPPALSQQRMTKETHPFGQELAQVTELAEEYNAGAHMAPIDEETRYLESQGLVKVSAADYLSVVQSLTTVFFSETEHALSPAPLWI
ncbi:hypothetical protein CDD81_2147 [Ophiocordyceps australis]|uniref:Uncharacterized protein n=1 Tax=Ophiocordyceps australis TaxID=1399860 RepID=A0A2C5XZK8_9HYPO|nr:hypothetical protein CDD81_2147 [Ophiocordyceps australis]